MGLKEYNNKLNKFGKNIVEGVLKKYPDLQKKASLYDFEKEVFTILKEKKNISDIVPNLRTKKQKTDLKKYNNKLNKFGKYIVEGVLKKYPDLHKKAMTSAERQQKIKRTDA